MTTKIIRRTMPSSTLSPFCGNKNFFTSCRLKEEDFILVFNLIFRNEGQMEYFEGDLPKEDKFNNLRIGLSSRPIQEERYIKKESFEMLSEEAKEVIETVLNSPDEILDFFLTSKIGMYSKRLIKKYFYKNRGWKKKKIDKVFRELSLYVDSM